MTTTYTHLIIDGERIGPSRGVGIGPRRVTSIGDDDYDRTAGVRDQDGRWLWQLRRTAQGVQYRAGSWQASARGDRMVYRMSPWVWRDSIARLDDCCSQAVAVRGGQRVIL